MTPPTAPPPTRVARPQFTDREQSLLSYYRDASLSNPRRTALLEWGMIGLSAALVVLWAWTDQVFYGLAGYAAVLVRLVPHVAAGKYAEDLRSIFREYEQALQAGDPASNAPGADARQP